MDQATALQAGYDEIKHQLSIPYVMEQYGHFPASTGARIKYHSPFRLDHTPSFDVWYDEKVGWRWGDYAENSSGDAIDLVVRLEPSITNGQALDRCRGYLADQGDYAGPLPQSSAATITEETLSLLRGDGARRAILAEDLGLPAEHIESWGVVANKDGGILIPHWDDKGELFCIKKRHNGEKRNVSGSRTTQFYGLWRLDEHLPVVLCEGETDAWAISHYIPGVTVLAVAGTGSVRPEHNADRLRARKVYLCFDSDEAGRTAAMQWAKALQLAAADVHYVPLPRGADARQVGAQLPRYFESARPVVPLPKNLSVTENGIIKPPRSEKGSATPLAPWRLIPSRVLRGDDSFAIEGELRPHGKQVIIHSEDFTSNARLARWAMKHQGTWAGTSADHQLLLEHLFFEATFVPEGAMVSRAGWHDGDFIWPGGKIGVGDWTYVPPPSAVQLDTAINIRPGPCDPADVLLRLVESHRPEITTPMLAWLAVAPLRPLFREFPILTITGGSGSGKTTLTDIFLQVFSGSHIACNLTSTTPYGVTAYFDSTNAIPIWFDEYRPGARKDAKSQLDQLLRDCWTGQPSVKGGMTENKREVSYILTDVPVVVTGEDSFVETSHTDRMVQVRLTKHGAGDISWFDRPTFWDGFAHQYLRWLLSGGLEKVPYIREIKTTPEGPDTLHDRQRTALGVLRLGWEILSEWMAHLAPEWEWPELDLSLLTHEAQESADTSPVLEMVRWALEETFRTEVVWLDEEHYVNVRIEPMLIEARKADIFTLPASNARGIVSLLREEYEGEHVRVSRHGKQVRVVRFPSHYID